MRYLIDTCLFVSIIEGRQVSDDVEYNNIKQPET